MLQQGIVEPSVDALRLGIVELLGLRTSVDKHSLHGLAFYPGDERRGGPDRTLEMTSLGNSQV